MTMSDISMEYAKALFMLAVENDSAKSYDEALELVSGLFAENPDYMKFLSSYSVSLDERIDALDKAFFDALPKDVLSFLKLLCEKRHIDEFFECRAQFKGMVNEMSRVSFAKVTSAIELNDAEKESLKEKLQKLSGHIVELEYAIDKSILGGLIVEMDGKIMDSSLRKHLKDVKEVMSK